MKNEHYSNVNLKVVACIPAYNVERTIASVIVKAQKYVDKVIVCDDGSTDMTADIAEKLGAEVSRHERNLGYGAALTTLFEKAREIRADVMITLDGDGQHNPCDIPKFLDPMAKGEAEMVVGSRFLSESTGVIPSYRKAGIKAITKFTGRIAYGKLTDAQSGFRAYDRRAIELINPSEMGMGASTEILIKAHESGLRVKEVPINVIYDEESSTHNPIRHGIDVVLSTIKFMSIRRPLMFYGIPGLLSISVASFFWLWTLQIYAAANRVETNIALIAIGASLVGLMLLTTAVMLWVLISTIKEATNERRLT